MLPYFIFSGGPGILRGARVSARARTRWFLFYTLYNNPGLRIQRKGHIEYMKVMKERLFKHYNLNKTSLGKLVKGINKSMAPVNLGHMNPVANLRQPENEAMLESLANRFILALQADAFSKQTGISTDKIALGIIDYNALETDPSATKGKKLWGRATRLAVNKDTEEANNDKDENLEDNNDKDENLEDNNDKDEILEDNNDEDKNLEDNNDKDKNLEDNNDKDKILDVRL